jgi:hypothetical protein
MKHRSISDATLPQLNKISTGNIHVSGGEVGYEAGAQGKIIFGLGEHSNFGINKPR